MYNDDMRINRTLRKIMIDEDVGQNLIAARIRRTKATVSNFMAESSNPTIATIEAIANAMDHDLRIQFIRRRDGKIIDCD